MFRHEGKSRTYIHNLRLASILSFVAGIVNVSGVLSVKVLTTNITGHFAFFAEDLSNRNYTLAIGSLLFILSFLIGAFVSNVLVEIVSRVRPRYSYTFPITIEIIILCVVGLFGSGSELSVFKSQVIACSLLFAMGLQNALVTKVSQSVVRTTHLTGLFTDLGIELSQLFFYRKTGEFRQLSRSIYLKLAIISCFFFGCLSGGFIYLSFALLTLAVAAVFLIIALAYDTLRFIYYRLKRKVQSR
ncbi:MAG: YoaK family protein [Chitinophagaceae bacterium]